MRKEEVLVNICEEVLTSHFLCNGTEIVPPNSYANNRTFTTKTQNRKKSMEFEWCQ